MTAGDIGHVMEIAASLKEAPHWQLAAFVTALDSESEPRRICLVAEVPETGAIAGFAVACLIGPEAELETIAVASAFQRQGLARRLLGVMAAELRKARVTEVMLEVRASNRAALGLYRALGFAETGRRPRYYLDPIEDAVLMALRLE